MAKKATNAEIRYAFAKALDYLWNGIYTGKDYRSEYICHAINKTPLNIAAPATRRGADAAMVIVCDRLRDRLGREHTVMTWLEDVALIPWIQLTPLQVQAYRKAWLEQLAEEFSK